MHDRHAIRGDHQHRQQIGIERRLPGHFGLFKRFRAIFVQSRLRHVGQHPAIGHAKLPFLGFGNRLKMQFPIESVDADSLQPVIRQDGTHIDEAAFILDPQPAAQILADGAPALTQPERLRRPFARRHHGLADDKSQQSKEQRHLKKHDQQPRGRHSRSAEYGDFRMARQCGK